MGNPMPGSRSASFRASLKDGSDGPGVTLEMLDRLNVAQASRENKECLDSLGGVKGLAGLLGVDLRNGLSEAQATALRERFGSNVFPSPPMAMWIELFVDALKVSGTGREAFGLCVHTVHRHDPCP